MRLQHINLSILWLLALNRQNTGEFLIKKARNSHSRERPTVVRLIGRSTTERKLLIESEGVLPKQFCDLSRCRVKMCDLWMLSLGRNAQGLNLYLASHTAKRRCLALQEKSCAMYAGLGPIYPGGFDQRLVESRSCGYFIFWTHRISDGATRWQAMHSSSCHPSQKPGLIQH